MKKEILTFPMTKEQIDDELAFLARYFEESNYQVCEVFFGFAWGNEYYGSKNWDYEKIETKDLVKKVKYLESEEYGELGYNDLSIRFPGETFEFLFCNDTDIHITFANSNDIIESFYNRWKKLGYSPAEWVKEENKKQRIRLN